jgi:hypothetical protein
MVVLRESPIKRRLNKLLLVAVLVVYTCSLAVAVGGVGVFLYSSLPPRTKGLAAGRVRKPFSAWMGMFDGSVGVALRGEREGGNGTSAAVGAIGATAGAGAGAGGASSTVRFLR